MVIIQDLEINLLFVKCYCISDCSISPQRRWAGPQPDFTRMDPARTLAHLVSVCTVSLRGGVGRVGHLTGKENGLGHPALRVPCCSKAGGWPTEGRCSAVHPLPSLRAGWPSYCSERQFPLCMCKGCVLMENTVKCCLNDSHERGSLCCNH